MGIKLIYDFKELINMRSCIYCGRELEQGEVCMCPQSAAHRAKKQNSSKTDANAPDANEKRTTYRTGYTGHQSRFDRVRDKHRAKRNAANSGGFKKTAMSFVKEFIKSPVDKVINPPEISKVVMLIIAAAQGAVAWLGMFFLYTGMTGSIFGILGKLLGFDGIAGYSAIGKMLMCIMAGAICGIVLFFLYTGVFYFINRFIFKSKTAYWDFSTRLSLIGIPFTVFGILGALLSLFSLRTLTVLLVCGLISSIVLMYEALRTEWVNRSPGAVMYAMLGGLFILFTFLCNLIRI